VCVNTHPSLPKTLCSKSGVSVTLFFVEILFGISLVFWPSLHGRSFLYTPPFSQARIMIAFSENPNRCWSFSMRFRSMLIPPSYLSFSSTFLVSVHQSLPVTQQPPSFFVTGLVFCPPPPKGSCFSPNLPKSEDPFGDHLSFFFFFSFVDILSTHFDFFTSLYRIRRNVSSLSALSTLFFLSRDHFSVVFGGFPNTFQKIFFLVLTPALINFLPCLTNPNRALLFR